jgi:hypothetical protein
MGLVNWLFFFIAVILLGYVAYASSTNKSPKIAGVGLNF